MHAAGDEQGEARQGAGAQRERGRPGGAGDAQVEPEDQQLVQHGVEHRHAQVQRQRHRGAPDAVEEAEHHPQGHRQRAAEDARFPVGQRQFPDPRFQPERRQQQRPAGSEQREKGNRRHRGPQAGPDDRTRPPPAPGAEGVRHQGLHAHADAAGQQDEHQHQEIGRAHGRHGRGRDAADEPGVGQVEHRLHAGVQEQRRGQQEDPAQVDPALAVLVDAQRRQAVHRRKRRPAPERGAPAKLSRTG
ncbi:MAG: hypothetical protein MUE63_14810 [Xanthomonadales bacterium]|nr:hypothetical protein [Xanthomonadales bacterium]